MKLTARLILNVSIAMLIIMAVWAVLFYFVFLETMNDEMNDALDNYSEQVIVRALSGESIPHTDNGTNSQYFLSPITAEEARSIPHISYHDEDVFIYYLNEIEPARVRRTVFHDANGQYYLLTVSMPTVEKEEIHETILFWIVLLYVLLLITVVLVNSIVFYRCTRPLFIFLKWLDGYRLGQPNLPLNNPTGIKEFARLNAVAGRAIDRIENSYEQQRQFIGNASHELQTPLAISINRVEMMLEDESLKPEQLENLVKIHASLQDIIKLNKSMLLLSRIDNGQFPEVSNVSFSGIVDKICGDYCSIYDYKDIRTDIDASQGDFVCTINEHLAQILITNLLKNAFVHTPEGGFVKISIMPDTFDVTSGPADKPLDTSRIFERFYHGHSRQKESTGLGLAIVRSICRRFGLSAGYSFSENAHTFSITRSTSTEGIPL